ncbi:hypothetical protein [Cylindrospermopsis raciborskii]|uniref:hypothetical protein n=1 Tax=Cylindrospermopsis raciborskii TaxID=77022 RepID=UPI003DA3C3A6
MLRGDRITLPTGDRSPIGTFHFRFPFGKRLTVNVFRQRINQLFQGGGDIWRRIAQHSLRVIAFRVPRVSSQGKNLNVLMNDCAALPTGDRSHLGTFHVLFPVGKRLTVNVFRQRINQLFQGVGIFGGRSRSTPFGRSLLVIIPRFLLKGKT